jgi:hypothetical protein
VTVVVRRPSSLDLAQVTHGRCLKSSLLTVRGFQPTFVALPQVDTGTRHATSLRTLCVNP